MKKILFLLPLLALSSLGITGCNPSKKARITYGTLVDQEAEEITYTALQTKIARGENFLISIYQDGLPCGCWTTFHDVLNQYVKEYKTKIYIIPRSQFSADDDSFGLSLLNDTTDPTFALVKDGKKVNEYIYGKNTYPMFTTLDGLREAVSKIARDPQYFYVDQAFLDNALFARKQNAIIYYLWSFCPDCNDAFPNVMMPYSEKHDFARQVWLIDIGIPGLLLDENGMWQGTGTPNYVQFLKEHHMSAAGDEVFGYDRGFVPTIQIWEEGKVKDMTVYFNDAITKEDDGTYKVSRSYYTEERVASLQYTDTVLQGLTVSEEDVEPNKDDEGTIIDYSWKKDAARKYHQPIMESFFDEYVL